MRQPKILTTLKTYDRALFVEDLMAGVTVAFAPTMKVVNGSPWLRTSF